MKQACLLLIWMFLLGGLAACDQAPPPSPPPAPTQSAVSPPSTPSDPPSAESSWPFFAVSDEADQSLSDDWLARNYLLVFDGSGSMSGRRCSAGRPMIEVAREAVIEWLTLLPEATQVGMVAFHAGGWSQMPLSNEREPLSAAVAQIKPGGSTPLTKAFEHAFVELTRQGRRQLGYGEYTILVVTDGVANNPQALAARVDQFLTRSPISIHTIGFCIGPDHTLNQPGRTIYKAADNPEDLRRGLQEVLAESADFDMTEF